MNDLFNFLVPLSVKEGAWVIQPWEAVMHDMVQELRRHPATIAYPPDQPRYRFAERGARGQWILVWVPEA